MTMHAERHHWLNTVVGILDQAFHLTDDEQVPVINVVSDLLEYLNIPDRSEPVTLPPPVALEVQASYYTNLLSGPRTSGLIRPVRAAGEGDIVVPIETWRESLLSMLTSSYPDIDPLERIVTSKALNDLLAAIGVPHRAASFLLDDIVRVHRGLDV